VTTTPHDTDNTNNTNDPAIATTIDHHHGFSILLRLDPDDLKKLDRLAVKKKLTRTAAIRESIRAWARRIL
jgi:hypothetical protein